MKSSSFISTDRETSNEKEEIWFSSAYFHTHIS